jgi:glycosyltransferase involved in cell wall biosynthesis
MEPTDLAIIIPALNEDKTIGNIIQEVIKKGDVIVVDDGSVDRTADIASKMGAIVVSHKKNLGYDAALNSGFNKACALNYKYILTFDADGQHSPDVIDKFISEIDNGIDIVIGVRDKRARAAEAFFSFLSKKIWNIQDPLCGMKAYKMKVFESLGCFDSYNSIGTELCIYGAAKKFTISELPFNVKERLDKPRLGSIFSCNVKILKSLIIGVLKYYRWRTL